MADYTPDPQFNNDFAQGCLQGGAPYCVQACPFHLDVRALITRIKRGSWQSAYTAYQQAVMFPRIVAALCPAPCALACPLAGAEAAIRLNGLEQALVATVKADHSPGYNVPQKSQRIAVIGGGPAGLACAVALGLKKYRVTVYEQQAKIGGALSQLLPEADYLPELEHFTEKAGVDLRLCQPIQSLDDIRADAVYIATGAGGADFGASGGQIPGVFTGGMLQGTDPVGAIQAGLDGAQAIERYLKTGLMQDAPATFRCLIAPPDLPERIDPPMIPAGAVYDRGEAQAEAGRCLLCDCQRCAEVCEFMQHYRKLPPKLANAIDYGLTDYTLDAVSNNRIVNSCSDCGACLQRCPVAIDTGYQIYLARRQMFDKGLIPPAYHDFLLRDLAHAQSGAAALLLEAPSGRNRSLFFPGCQLGASDPGYVLGAYELLLAEDPDIALLLGCCGAPARWAGDETLGRQVAEKNLADWQRLGQPEVIFGCANCHKFFQRFLPQIQGRSLYSVLAPGQAADGEPCYALADPCSVREAPAWYEAVRDLLDQRGQAYTPLFPAMAEIGCCSFGGDIRVAAPQLAEQMIANRVSRSPLPYLTYCANCRDIYAAAGKPSLHLLDLLLPGREKARSRPAPGLTERRRNREGLRRQLLARYQGKPPDREPAAEPLPLLITPELAGRMDRELVLESDFRQVLAAAAETGRWLEDQAGNATAHLRLGAVTLWLVYRPEGGGYRVLDFYTHRVQIEEKGMDGEKG